MKFGIMTFSRANNYGAVLQAYALRKKLQDKGYESRLINYRCRTIDAMHAFKKFKKDQTFRQNWDNFLWNIIFYPRMRAFDRFRKDIQTKDYWPDTIAQASDEFDCFITGSDQVFNLALTGGDTAYYLDFASDKNIRAAYAVSMGDYLEEYAEVYKKNVPAFDLLSFREQTGADIIKDRLGISGEVVPDPTLLYTGEEWIKLLNVKKKQPKKPYLCVYALTEKPELFAAAEKIADELGLEIHIITRRVKCAGKGDKYVRIIGPEDFVSEIYNADYVVTPSFHGTVFSILLGKPFTITSPPRLPERITDLLDELGIGSRYAGNSTDYDLSPIDYQGTVYPRLEKLRQRGEAYLDKIIAATAEKVGK